MSNSLDPDQARHFVGPDLGPNRLQRLSADGASRQELKSGYLMVILEILNLVFEYIKFFFIYIDSLPCSPNYFTILTYYLFGFFHLDFFGWLIVYILDPINMDWSLTYR